MKRGYLEITDACNLNCPFCTNSKGNSFISLEDFDLYTTQIKEYTNYLYLHVLGEPLLHPNFEEILNILDKKGFNLQLVSNGTLLSNHLNILNHQCLRKLSISIHSINNIDIEDNYFKTIDYIIEHNDDKYIELRFYGKENLNDKLNNYLKELEDRYSFNITPKINSYSIKNNVYVYFEEIFDWPSLDNKDYGLYGTCKGAKNQLAILHNGDVTLCCLDPKGINKIGNLKENTLKEIIESNEYKKIIQHMNDNKLTKELCRHCSYRLRFSKQ